MKWHLLAMYAVLTSVMVGIGADQTATKPPDIPTAAEARKLSERGAKEWVKLRQRWFRERCIERIKVATGAGDKQTKFDPTCAVEITEPTIAELRKLGYSVTWDGDKMVISWEQP